MVEIVVGAHLVVIPRRSCVAPLILIPFQLLKTPALVWVFKLQVVERLDPSMSSGVVLSVSKDV